MNNKNYLASKTILSIICDDTDGITRHYETDNLHQAIGNILDKYVPDYNSAIEILNNFRLEKGESIPKDAPFTDGPWDALAFVQNNLSQLPVKVVYYNPSKLVQWIISIRTSKLIDEMISQAHTKYGLGFFHILNHVTYDDLLNHIHKQFKDKPIVDLENKIFHEMLSK